MAKNFVLTSGVINKKGENRQNDDENENRQTNRRDVQRREFRGIYGRDRGRRGRFHRTYHLVF